MPTRPLPAQQQAWHSPQLQRTMRTKSMLYGETISKTVRVWVSQGEGWPAPPEPRAGQGREPAETVTASQGQRKTNSADLSTPNQLRAPSSHSPAPRFPGKGPPSLFLQEVHLQPLHLQEPAQAQEPPARRRKTSSEMLDAEEVAVPQLCSPHPLPWAGASRGKSCPPWNRCGPTPPSLSFR